MVVCLYVWVCTCEGVGVQCVCHFVVVYCVSVYVSMHGASKQPRKRGNEDTSTRKKDDKCAYECIQTHSHLLVNQGMVLFLQSPLSPSCVVSELVQVTHQLA